MSEEVLKLVEKTKRDANSYKQKVPDDDFSNR